MLLNCHTYYSLRYGTLSIDELLKLVKANGYTQFVLTDINNTSAAVDTMRMAQGVGVRPVLGIDVRNGIHQQYVAIAKNNAGFKELNTFVSEHLQTEQQFDAIAPAFKHVVVVYPFAVYQNQLLREHEFVGFHHTDLKKLPFTKKKISPSKRVVWHPVTFTGKRSYNAHRLLRAIHNNTLLSKLPVTEQADPSHMILPIHELEQLYAGHEYIWQNTRQLLEQCEVKIEFGKFSNKNLRHYTGSEEGDMDLLNTESQKGLFYRFGASPSHEVMARMTKELTVIQQMGFASYFLINWDIVSYARQKKYYYVGRGSGANSLIAYLLRITDVDPIKLDLYFERFINPFRSNPPDFDIDFSWLDRDDITQYIFNRFGQNGKAALVGAYTTFQFDSVTRELGKVFGLPPNEIDKLQQHPAHADQIGQLVLSYSKLIHGFPSNVSIHASGILISEEPVNTYVTTFLPPKGYPTTHFSMLEAEDIGLYKFDILSQRGLGKIKDTLELVKYNHGVEIDIHNTGVIMNDEKVKTMLRDGEALGCFYVESPGMRMLLCKLRADDYLRLVAASSIIRPGVAKSGMMREYILRYRSEERRNQARTELPELYTILEETYGVMVYQEDVIKVAHLFAGLTLAEADYLRRGMSWKFKQRNEFHRVEQQFFNNCRDKGYNEKVIRDIWEQIESFANFAFSKGHSASYAVESYQALYLKAYYPVEYMVATINNGGGFFRIDTYVNEAVLHGATVQLPCVNKSTQLSVIEHKTVYLGLSLIAELENNTVKQLVHERLRNGPYADLPDFIKRVSLSIEQLRLLIRAGAFGFTQKSRQQLLWDVHMLTTENKPKKHVPELFYVKPPEYQLPPLRKNEIEEAFDEMELIGFTRKLPFHLLQNKLPSTLLAKELKTYLGQTITIVGYLVHVKTTYTSKGDKMHFGTFLDLEGHWIDTVHFPPVAKAYPFKGKGCYTITGKVTVEFDFYSIEVICQDRLPYYDREKLADKEPLVQEPPTL